MDKDKIEERVKLITSELEQTKENYAKLEGHLAEAQHWLDKTIKNEAEEKLIISDNSNSIASDET